MQDPADFMPMMAFLSFTILAATTLKRPGSHSVSETDPPRFNGSNAINHCIHISDLCQEMAKPVTQLQSWLAEFRAALIESWLMEFRAALIESWLMEFRAALI